MWSIASRYSESKRAAKMNPQNAPQICAVNGYTQHHCKSATLVERAARNSFKRRIRPGPINLHLDTWMFFQQRQRSFDGTDGPNKQAAVQGSSRPTSPRTWQTERGQARREDSKAYPSERWRCVAVASCGIRNDAKAVSDFWPLPASSGGQLHQMRCASLASWAHRRNCFGSILDLDTHLLRPEMLGGFGNDVIHIEVCCITFISPLPGASSYFRRDADSNWGRIRRQQHACLPECLIANRLLHLLFCFWIKCIAGCSPNVPTLGFCDMFRRWRQRWVIRSH